MLSVNVFDRPEGAGGLRLIWRLRGQMDCPFRHHEPLVDASHFELAGLSHSRHITDAHIGNNPSQLPDVSAGLSRLARVRLDDERRRKLGMRIPDRRPPTDECRPVVVDRNGHQWILGSVHLKKIRVDKVGERGPILAGNCVLQIREDHHRMRDEMVFPIVPTVDVLRKRRG